MIKSLQALLALLVPSVVLVAPVRAAGDRDSPEDVFKSFAAAMKKADVKVMMSHMTRASQSATVGGIGFLALIDKGFYGFMNDRITPKQKKEYRAAIEEVMNRHGLSDDAVTRIFEKMDRQTTTYEQFVPIGELVKDKAAFISEILKVSRDVQKSCDGLKEMWEATVKEIKIDGQRAKAQATFPGADGKEKAATIYFKLESGVWKIDLIDTSRNWPQPPPPPQVQQQATQAQPPPNHSNSRPGLLRRLFPCLRSR
jgi:hypothetical protein